MATRVASPSTSAEQAGWELRAKWWPQGPAPLWRLQSDAVNCRLLERWLPAGFDSVLKTDLFDEYVSEGLLPALRPRARQIVGIDIADSIVGPVRRQHPGLEAIRADLRALPFEDSRFDAIVSNSTLDHFDDVSGVRSALSEVARVTRPGGRVIVTLDNPLNPMIAVRNRLPERPARRLRGGFPYETGWTCGPRRLRTLLAEAGLQVRELTAILHAPRALVAALPLPRSERERRRAIGALVAAERLQRLPTRYLSGHFVAALAIRPWV
ncbi:MAG: class I SAM-dependent methyltransferase [Solirubrobacterales bacterium]